MQKQLTVDEIMDRLSRICFKSRCYVSTRPDFPSGPSKWHVILSGVVVGGIHRGGFSSSITTDCDSGATPEDAIRNVWNGVLKLAKNEELALVRFNCPANVPIPGEDPQVWVRWNSELDDWEDAPVKGLPAEMLRPYKEQIWRDKLGC